MPASAPLPRIPFVLLVLSLLGGGLVCLLVINTTLGASSFQISQLQAENASLSQQQQSLQGQIQQAQGPAEIARRAYALGMRSQLVDNILDLRTQRIYRLPGGAGATGQISLSTAGMTDNGSVGTAASGSSPGSATNGHRTPGAGPAGHHQQSRHTARRARKHGSGTARSGK